MPKSISPASTKNHRAEARARNASRGSTMLDLLGMRERASEGAGNAMPDGSGRDAVLEEQAG
jgi:hypothetical protein